MTAFEKGKQVMLACGGPVMVMETPVEPDKAACIWFAGSELRRETFDLALLNVYRDYRSPADEDDDPYAGGRSRVTGY